MDIIQILGSSAELLNAYEPKTTFWMDFSIADKFGLYATSVLSMNGKTITSISQSLLWFLTTRFGNGMRQTMLLHTSMILFGEKQTFGQLRI